MNLNASLVCLIFVKWESSRVIVIVVPCKVIFCVCNHDVIDEWLHISLIPNLQREQEMLYHDKMLLVSYMKVSFMQGWAYNLRYIDGMEQKKLLKLGSRSTEQKRHAIVFTDTSQFRLRSDARELPIWRTPGTCCQPRNMQRIAHT